MKRNLCKANILRSLTNRVREQKGESLGEVLVSLLISVLAVTMLTGMIAAATRIIDKSSRSMQERYAMTNAEADTSTDS